MTGLVHVYRGKKNHVRRDDVFTVCGRPWVGIVVGEPAISRATCPACLRKIL